MEDSRLTPVVSIAGLFVLWIVAAILTDDPQILPTPLELLSPLKRDVCYVTLQVSTSRLNH